MIKGLLDIMILAQTVCASHFWPKDKRECEDRVIRCIRIEAMIEATNSYGPSDKIDVISCLYKNKD